MKILKIVLSLIPLLTSSLIAQNLDSLYHTFINLNSYSGKFKIPAAHSVYGNSPTINKCGFSLVSDIKNNFDKFSPEQQEVMKPMFNRVQLSNSMITPSGKFKIHYDAEGVNKPGYNLDTLAKALDYVYDFEVTQLGYIPPPPDNGEGGDDKYDIYIIDISFYGVTYPETLIGDNRSTSFIIMDNDFAGSSFATHGIDAARVTVAHEFHHAIQLGGYRAVPLAESDKFYYEITATSFEEFAFDYVNDYYAYMKSYFKNPSKTFGRFASGVDGYDLAIWNIYLQKKYGYDIIKRTWELIGGGQRALGAIENALVEKETSFKSSLNEFGEWTYFTGHRAKLNVPYFEEAKNYPLITPMLKVNYIPPSEIHTINSKAASNNFLQFVDNTQGRSDTLIALITNSDIFGGYNTVEPDETSFTFELSTDTEEGNIKVADNYYFNTNLTSSNERIFKQGLILNNVPSTILDIRELDYVYPQPFRRNAEHLFLNIPVDRNSEETEAELYIFTISMDLVFSERKNIVSLVEEPKITWDGRDDEGNFVTSGVYIYVTKRGNEVKKGKLVILND